MPGAARFFYLLRGESPHEIVAISREFCVGFSGAFSRPWEAYLDASDYAQASAAARTRRGMRVLGRSHPKMRGFSKIHLKMRGFSEIRNPLKTRS